MKSIFWKICIFEKFEICGLCLKCGLACLVCFVLKTEFLNIGFEFCVLFYIYADILKIFFEQKTHGHFPISVNKSRMIYSKHSCMDLCCFINLYISFKLANPQTPNTEQGHEQLIKIVYISSNIPSGTNIWKPFKIIYESLLYSLM